MSEVHDRVVNFLRSRPDVTTADLAAYAGLGESTVKNYAARRIPETARIREEMDRVMRLVVQGEILQPGGGKAVVIAEPENGTARRVSKKHEFYITETVRRVGQVLRYCTDQSSIGVITGDYGIGKTEAVAAWRRGEGRGVEAIVFEFEIFTSNNTVSWIQALGEALGVPNVKCGMNDAARVFHALVAHLRENPILMIFDQVEMVRPRVFQGIRQLHDRTRDAGVGVVLVAAPILLRRLKSMPDLGALESRVGIYAPLSGLNRSEMVAIVKQEGITDVDDAAFDLWWKATAGSMRRLMASLDLMKAKHQGKRVTEKTITGVAGHLWGMAVSRVREEAA